MNFLKYSIELSILFWCILLSELTIIITTCRRYEALKRCLDSIKECAPECEVLIMIDDNDFDTYEKLCDAGYQYNCFLSKERLECCALTNDGVKFCQTEYFVYLNDDMVLIKKGCFQEALSIFRLKFPDNLGFLTFNDGITNGKIATQGLTSKTFVRECLDSKTLCHPDYKHFYWDLERAVQMVMMGKFLYCGHIMVKHEHYAVTKKSDEIYERSNNDFLKQDGETFKRRNP